MNPAVSSMLSKYKCESRQDFENALKEIIQEITLLGLWRAKFFEHAAFYGGTALRIMYGLDRFSEDMDFSLLSRRADFNFGPYLKAIEAELAGMDFTVEVTERVKNVETPIESAFIKAGTKETLLKIEIPEEILTHVVRNDRIKIKLEVDTHPPGGFQTEAKTILQPIPFSVRTYRQSDLFAGKLHAILQRSWKGGRIKGRDYYDFVWYVSRSIPANLYHLEQRLRQSGGWLSETSLTRKDLISLLEAKLSVLDVNAAKRDVLPFLKDRMAVELWSREFFLSLLPRLKVIGD